MSDSTKEKIKQVALSLFSRQGYDGTTMNDVAGQVGIKTPSLYAHFSGKEELFFSVYEQLAEQYVNLMDGIFARAEKMPLEERFFYIFEQYIMYYVDNPEIQSFWNQITLFTPPPITEQFRAHVTACDERVQKKTEDLFREGIQQGLLRGGSPEKMSWSYRMMREGVLNWMMVVPGFRDRSCIKSFWDDLWFGLKG